MPLKGPNTARKLPIHHDPDMPPLEHVNSANYIVEHLSNKSDMDEFIACIREGLRERRRTEVRLFAEMHKLVGQQVQLSVMVVNALGVPLEEARSAVDFKRELDSYDDIERYALCERYVLDAWARDPKLRERSALLSSARLEGE
jgi:hypothetical protein